MANINGTFLSDLLLGDIGIFDDDDTINGFGGNDTIRPGDGEDDVDGGNGIDTVDYSSSLSGFPSAGVTVNLLNGEATDDGFGNRDTLANIENVTGTAFDDHITDDLGDNILRGLGGDDVILSNGGNDILYGNAGNDSLIAFIDAGVSQLFGGAGDDILVSNDGSGLLDGGSGDDTLIANGNGNEASLFGGSGDDLMRAGDMDDLLNGGAGDDELDSGSGNDTQTGGTGDDIFRYNVFKNGESGGNDIITDFQDDGGPLGFLNTITGEDSLHLELFFGDSDDVLVAQRDGNTLNILFDEDRNANGLNDATQVGSIQFASAFIVNNLDEDDLSDTSSEVIFV